MCGQKNLTNYRDSNRDPTRTISAIFRNNRDYLPSVVCVSAIEIRKSVFLIPSSIARELVSLNLPRNPIKVSLWLRKFRACAIYTQIVPCLLPKRFFCVCERSAKISKLESRSKFRFSLCVNGPIENVNCKS